MQSWILETCYYNHSLWTLITNKALLSGYTPTSDFMKAMIFWKYPHRLNFGSTKNEGGIYNFQWQFEIFIRRHLTHLGRSFKVKLFLGWLLTPGRVRHKTFWCYGAGNMEKQAPWFFSDSSRVPPVPAHCHWFFIEFSGPSLLSKIAQKLLTLNDLPKYLLSTYTGRRFFQFATEEFKCRPLKSCRKLHFVDWSTL